MDKDNQTGGGGHRQGEEDIDRGKGHIDSQTGTGEQRQTDKLAQRQPYRWGKENQKKMGTKTTIQVGIKVTRQGARGQRQPEKEEGDIENLTERRRTKTARQEGGGTKTARQEVGVQTQTDRGRRTETNRQRKGDKVNRIRRRGTKTIRQVKTKTTIHVVTMTTRQ